MIAEIILCQLLWVPAFLGFGRLFYKTLCKDSENLSLGECGMLGIATFGPIGTLLNLLVPLKLCAPFVLAIGSLLFIRDLYKKKNYTRYEWIAFTLLLLGVSYSASFSIPVFDFGAYHLPISKWAYEQPIPLGVGNLNKFFGYHSDWYIAGALTLLPGFGWLPLFTLDCLLLTFLLTYLLKESREASASSYLCFSLLFILGILNAPSWTGSNNNDLPLLLYSLAGLVTWIRKEKEPNTLFLTTVWVTAAIVIKLSAIPIFICFLILTIIYLLKSNQWNRYYIIRLTYLFTFFFVPWALRGFLTTGCIVAPTYGTCFPYFSWTISSEISHELTRFIRDVHVSPLYFHSVAEFYRAFTKHQVPVFVKDQVFRFFISGMFISIILFVLKYRRISENLLRFLKQTSIVFLAGTLFWLIQAPSPRFGQFYMIGLVAIGFSFFFSTLNATWYRKSIVFSFLLVSLLWGKRLMTLQFTSPYRLTHESMSPAQNPKTGMSKNGVPFNKSEIYAQCFDIAIPCAYDEMSDFTIEKLASGRYLFKNASN